MATTPPFADRRTAGKRLAAALAGHGSAPRPLVLGLPRGGVPVAYEVALALRAPLDVFVVRKIGVPGHEELAMGAVASGGVRVMNDELVKQLGIPPREVEEAAAHEVLEIARRELLYRDKRPMPSVRGATVLLVDDGLATAATMRVAVEALRAGGPSRIVCAVPVGAPDACAELRAAADEVVCALTASPLVAVSAWYADFAPVEDDEVRRLLADANRSVVSSPAAPERADGVPPA